MESFIASIRLVAATMLICVAGYSAAVWAVGQVLMPGSAQGSLIAAADGKVIGSSQVAQNFTEPRYFWPRPSAVDYNGAGAGGSNKSPTSTDIADRARETVARYGATAENPLPAELAAASGAGLDPHISERGALYQAARVAQARGLPQAGVEALIHEHAFAPGAFLAPDRLVNVLELNLALDRVETAG
ncbi:Potassium-transporting ATPase [Parvibaculum lavamentivorans DS-1]|uniref:Potassium-transporting ATPase KdpC subunit n=1 Tax=Parvibaculum lavamentivorans (strain DS-1 / DSM 13023 / NCIMB 13966) TaxID=402881 RepID=KDPC_PARL1|nr:potassium-transporting ATPase subunit C [Parvibaculum lavamentivorans]A7HRV5.1 RecName: Full=Potassium-transporting ATPase KdpC subunit; AltName: Full=ATP phosphohydrolase [potassium-transporting] C chain; AltName: Full=Potassium-binding and translocating subunit C; AltName: Full=Potassium-translocating ATPase C chain [Parvibaculum lavamentivorans DS-1]ABS62638.1 Potassium-transporting ATPase [Parvibaculum lavamentivorans DS-1]